MRNNLGKIEDVRDTFIGTFEREGTKNGYKGPERTLLLLNVIRKSDGKLMTDHLWFNLTKGFQKACLAPGDMVEFDARVKEYEKGYKGYRDDVYRNVTIDYKLSHPTKIKKCSREQCA